MMMSDQSGHECWKHLRHSLGLLRARYRCPRGSSKCSSSNRTIEAPLHEQVIRSVGGQDGRVPLFGETGPLARVAPPTSNGHVPPLISATIEPGGDVIAGQRVVGGARGSTVHAPRMLTDRLSLDLPPLVAVVAAFAGRFILARAVGASSLGGDANAGCPRKSGALSAQAHDSSTAAARTAAPERYA